MMRVMAMLGNGSSLPLGEIPLLAADRFFQAICDAAEGGGYILGTAEAIAPETPADSLRAASEAAREFGVYG